MLTLTLVSLFTLASTTLALSPPLSTPTCTLSTPSNIAPGTLTAENGCTHYHEVVKGDSCLNILSYYTNALSLKAFYAANPSVDSKCFNLAIGTSVCVTGPVNVAPGSLTLDTGCTKFRKVVKGDTCESIVKSIGDITLADFARFNSKVDNKCSNLPLNLQVCTCDGGKGSSPVPSPGHEDEEDCEEEEEEEEEQHPSPSSSAQPPAPTITITPSPPTLALTPSPPPPPSAVVVGCDMLEIVAAGDTCASFAAAHGSTEADIAALNPTLNCAALVAGSSICVGAGLPLVEDAEMLKQGWLRRHRRNGNIRRLS